MKTQIWNHHLNFSCYGARIGTRSNDARALAELQTVFPPHWRLITSLNVDWQYSLHFAPPTRSGRKPFHTLFSNDEQLARNKDFARLVQMFEQDVQLMVAQKARGKVFVHAGVVGWRGRAIIIPGRSYTGKSTLVRALVRAGAMYYSDEYAVLDERGRVHPFARQLALRDEARVNHKLAFEELGGGGIGKHPIPVGTILATKFSARAKWRPRVLTPGLGALELLANTVTARSKSAEALQTLTRVTMDAIILKSARGEADALAQELLSSA